MLPSDAAAAQGHDVPRRRPCITGRSDGARVPCVLVLRDMEGLSAKEVGAIMGLNERAVKSRLHRARLFVRRELSARGITHHDDHQSGDSRA